MSKKYPRKTPRFVEELKNPVSAMLEECINDDDSTLSMLRRIWPNAAGNLEGRILEELDHYWTGLAQQGQTLEEAAIACGHPELAEMVKEERQRRRDA